MIAGAPFQVMNTWVSLGAILGHSGSPACKWFPRIVAKAFSDGQHSRSDTQAKGLGSKVLVSQAREPELESQNPHKNIGW